MTLGEAVAKEMGHISHFFPTVMNLQEYAAFKLAEAQHAPGVSCRYNYQRFRVEYVRPDGTLVPTYEYYLKLAKEGKI